MIRVNRELIMKYVCYEKKDEILKEKEERKRKKKKEKRK